MAEPKGKLVASGTFKIDRSRALGKLAEFQLAEPSRFILSLVRCAVASGTTAVWIDGGRLRFSGRPLGPEELEDPFGCLFDEQKAADPRSKLLAVALLGALKHTGKPVALEGGPEGGRRRVIVGSPLEFGPVDTAGDGPGTVVWIEGSFEKLESLLTSHCWASPCPIYILERELPRGRRLDHGVYFEEDGRYGWVGVPMAPEGATEVSLYALGVLAGQAEIPGTADRVEGYVADSGLALDASQSSVVRDERFQSAAASVARASERLLEETCEHLRRSLPVTAELVLHGSYAAAWRRELITPRLHPYPEQGVLGKAARLLDRLRGSDLDKLDDNRARVRFDAVCARWAREALRRRLAAGGGPLAGVLAPPLLSVPLFVGTRGSVWSLGDLRREASGGRLRASKALDPRRGPDGPWCSTKPERDAFAALAGAEGEIQ